MLDSYHDYYKAGYKAGLKDVDVEYLRSRDAEARNLYLKIISTIDHQFDYMSNFMSNANSNNFEKVIDGRNTINELMSELAEMDNDLYQMVLRDAFVTKEFKRFRELLQGKAYFQTILDTMGEAWYRKILSSYGLDFDDLQKQSKDRRYS